jgi:ERCC4-type nuclease
MLSLNEQKNRLKKKLEQTNNIIWQENKGERYRISKHDEVRSCLWLRITKGSESFAIATTGSVTAQLEGFIIKMIRVPKNKEGSHRDWLNVRFEDAMQVLKAFDEPAQNLNSAQNWRVKSCKE